MKHTLHHVFKIYKRDIHNILTNWVVAVIIGGLLFLPSLYAWLNIYASMDPYAHTGNMKIAVVNEDTGTTAKGQDIDVGKELTVNLTTNKNFAWHFTSRQKAIAELNNGDYFAVIIVPNDFSEKLTSILSDKPTKAHIDYYVNEKINPIAPKITSKGASVLTQQVSSEFIATVNGTLFSIFNTLGVEIEQDIPDFRKFENYIFTIEQHLPDIESFLTQTTEDVQQAEKLMNRATTQIPEVQKMTNDGLTTVQQGLDLINDAEAVFTKLSPIVKKDLQTVQNLANQFNQLFERLEHANLDTSGVTQAKENLQNEVNLSLQKVNSSIQTLEALQKLTQADAETRKQLEKDLQSVLTSLQQTDSEDAIHQIANKQIIQQLETLKGDLQANPSLTDYSFSSLTALNQLKSLLSALSGNLQQLGSVDEETIKKDIADVQKVAQNAATHINEFLSYYVNQL